MATRVDTASRRIRASASAIYRSLLDRDALLAWLPPTGMRAQFHSFDARGYRMSLTYEEPPAGGGKSDADTDIVNVAFVELVPDERVVERVKFESSDVAFAEPMTMTWQLTPEDGGTLVTVTAEDVPAAIAKADHDAGLRSSLENLERYVTSQP